MKRYKFEALVTPDATNDDDARAKLGFGSHRMVLRAANSETRRSQVFRALVDAELIPEAVLQFKLYEEGKPIVAPIRTPRDTEPPGRPTPSGPQ